MHLHTQDHTQEPSIGMIVPHFSCRMGMYVNGYTRLFGKSMTTLKESLIDCIWHLVLEGRVWLYIICMV